MGGRRVIQMLRVNALTLTGRMSTMTAAGAAKDIGASYAYGELMEIRADVSSWTGVGSSFQLMLLKSSCSIDATTKTLRAMEVTASNADNIDVGTLQVFMFNVIGKGNSTITLMRGGEVKCEWKATDIVTNARALTIEYAGLSTPTNLVYGIYFEKESASAAMAAKFQEIRLKEGPCVISSTSTPNGVITAPKGSLCLVTNGSGVGDRAFINTDSGTTWTAITTVA